MYECLAAYYIFFPDKGTILQTLVQMPTVGIINVGTNAYRVL